MGGAVLLYDTPELMAKDNAQPFQTIQIHANASIDDLRWNPADPEDKELKWFNSFVVCCNGGLRLYRGPANAVEFAIEGTYDAPSPQRRATCGMSIFCRVLGPL